jgi:outer membrane protein
VNPDRRVRTFGRAPLLVIALFLLQPKLLHAQQTQVPATLSLEDAIAIARSNSPDYLASAARSASADWAVREAYGALLPGANVSSSLSWQDAGNQRFGIFNSSDLGLGTSSTSYYSSSYSVGLSYRVSGATLLGPGREKATRRATEAQIELSGKTLDTDVTMVYISVRRSMDGVTLAQQELQRAEENLKLAQARVAVGAAIPLDATQAEVDRGRAEVALLQAQNLVQTERLRLGQTMGIRIDPAVSLTTTFAVFDFPWQLEDLQSIARETNPDIRAARATEAASKSSVSIARSAYLPSLSMSAGFSGFTREAGNENYLIDQARSSLASQQQSCQLFNGISSGLSQPLPGRPADCSQYVLTSEQEAQIRSGNNVFPFDFSREPLSVSLTVSLPIFQGFSRERQIEEAKVQEKSATYQLRARELRTQTAVETNYLNVATARQTVELEQRNRQLADDQLRLAREKYRVGTATFLELQDAETVKARADRAYLNAVYGFFENLASLEAAVGRPLRAGEGR